jgi:hypothetical protein
MSIMEPRQEQETSKDLDFAKAAAGKQGSFAGEFWYFLRNNKKWWLTPIIVILSFVAVLVILGSSAAAPYIYTLF